jgi:hypothetical protein
MTDDIAISYPEGGELSDTDRETVDALVDRLRTSVDIDEAGLPPLTVERTEGRWFSDRTNRCTSTNSVAVSRSAL